MTPDYKLCDVCQEQIPAKLNCFVTTGLGYNGHDEDRVGKYVELCAICSATMIQHLTRGADGDYSFGKRIVEWVDKQVRNKKKGA